MSPQDAWLRYFWLWEIYFGLALFISIGAVGLSDAPIDAQLIASGLLVITALWYGFFGRAAILSEHSGWRVQIYLAVTILLLILATLAVRVSSFAMFAIAPQAFIALPLVAALAISVLGAFTPWTIVLIERGDWRTVLWTILPIGLLTTTFGLVVHHWISRIVDQSNERKELIAELEKSRSEVRRLSHEAGVAEERQRLAGEIHDTLAQGFASVITLTQAAESEVGNNPTQARKYLALVLHAARENLTEARALVTTLTPMALVEAPLTAALQRLVEKTAQHHQIPATFSYSGTEKKLPTGIEVVLLRAGQEALTNVGKHARATEVSVQLNFADHLVVLSVTDDGCGFNPAEHRQGFGLSGMQTRAEQVGGRLSVHSAPGSGTTITLEVPL